MAEMTRWLWERLFETGGLLQRLEPLGVDQEAEIKQLCEEEIASWRARPTMKIEASLQEPLRHARNAIRERLALREDNRWFNPREGTFEHLALKYLNFTPDQWNDLRADTEERFARRISEQQHIPNPDALLRKAEELLKGQLWDQLALGITLATGRRLTEVLKTAKFSPKTAYTLWFEGQLKTQDRVLPPYEIPTLVQAQIVLDAFRRLRESLDCSHLSNDQVSDQYGPIMRKLADQQLCDLIPKRSEKVNLYTHISRSIYGRLCVLYFCPPITFDLHYMATILGHYWYFDEKDEKRRQNLQSTLHYFDYVISDGHGNIDGRRGIWLGEPGVVVLDAFRPQEVTDMKRSKQKTSGDEQPLSTQAPKSHSIVRCTPGDRNRFNAEGKRRAITDVSQLFALLLDENALFQQMVQLLQPFSAELSTPDPVQTLQALLELYQGKQDVAVSRHLQEHWGVSLEEIDALFERAKADGYEQPATFFEGTLGKRDSFRAGAQKRAQHYQQTDFSQLPFSELEHIRAPEAAQERVRRIVQTIMRHNLRSQPRDRWYINAATVNNLKVTRHSIIDAYLKEHHQELERHHQELGIEPRYNRKMEPITDMITIPEEPLGAQ